MVSHSVLVLRDKRDRETHRERERERETQRERHTHRETERQKDLSERQRKEKWIRFFFQKNIMGT